jgi:SAM-dependent methyltransferase
MTVIETPAPAALGAPVSRLCTAASLRSHCHLRWRDALGLPPNVHRKLWEYTWIAAAAEEAGMLAPGRRGLGFGIGREPLAAGFAARGVAVLATDAPSAISIRQGWHATGQFAQERLAAFHPGLIDREAFDRLVTFRAVDMTSVPRDLRGFDFCWSSCALEHLGSLRAGLDFIEASLRTLRPGGLALHTTEFNLDDGGTTLETTGLSLYRRRELLPFLQKLADRGHDVWPVSLDPGDEPEDRYVDAPPFSPVHLKVLIEGFRCTSIGLGIRRRA